MDRHESDKVVYPGPPEEYAPEVAPSDQPMLHHHDSEGIQVGYDDTKIVVEKVESTEDKELITSPGSRRRKTCFCLTLSMIVLIVALSVGLSVGLARRSIDNIDNSSTTADVATIPSTSNSTGSFTSIDTVFATAAAAPMGCLEQANGNQSAICAEPGALCPKGYRSVRWNGGCPHVETGADWRCCI